MTFKEAMHHLARDYLIRALEENRGSIKRTAAALGVHRATLHKYLHRYGVTVERKVSCPAAAPPVVR